MPDHFFQEKRSPDHIKRSKAVRIRLVKSRGEDSVHIWPNNVDARPLFLAKVAGIYQREITNPTTWTLYLTMRGGVYKKIKGPENHAPPFIEKKSGNVDGGRKNTAGLHGLHPRKIDQFQPIPRGLLLKSLIHNQIMESEYAKINT